MEKFTEINGKMYPANLSVLLESKNQEDYRIEYVYYLQLKHSLIGFFPALIKEVDQSRIVLTTNKDLLEKVWRKLSPRKSEIRMSEYYIHNEEPIGYMLYYYKGNDASLPKKLLTEKEFLSLIEKNDNPFEWAPGLVGEDMTEEEFLKTLENAIKKV